MPAVKAPGRYAADCGSRCSLSEENLSAEAAALLADMINSGATQPATIAALAAIGTKVHRASLQRHRAGHVHPIEDEEMASSEDISLEDTLLAIVRAGARQIRAGKVRISADTTISAVNAIMKIRGGAEDPMLALLESLDEGETHASRATAPLEELRDGPSGYGPAEDES